MRRSNLARLLLLPVLFASCAPPEKLGTDPSPQLDGVVVSPVSVSIGTGETATFEASGHMSDGTTSTVTVSWSATGGVVSSSGVYTAGSTAGTYRVIGATASGDYADTAVVTVSEDPVPVTLISVSLSPGSATLTPGGSQSFTATGHFSNGTTGSIPVTWTATGGTVNGSGSYVAGATTGNYRVIATATAAALADTAAVVIQAAPVTLTSVEVTPPLDTLTAGGSRTFSATGHYSDGSSGAVTVTWTATGGTISGGGTYTAGNTPGNFRVIGRNTAANKADTSTVVIKAAPVTLTAVVVNPPSVTLDPGNTQTFSATGQYSDGSSGAVAVTWLATGGTITTGGVYTAGSTTGTFRVIGSHSSGKADTSAITISQVQTPTGDTLLVENFDNSNAGARGWYANENPTISTVEKHSGAGSLQMAWQQGASNPVNGASLRHLFTSTDRVYIRYWVKYSTNFVGSGAGQTAHPHEFDLLTDKDDMWIGPSATHMTAIIEHNWATGSGVPRLGVTDVLNIDETKIGVDLTNTTESRAVGGCNGNSDGYPTGCYSVSQTQHFNEKIWLGAQAVLNNTPSSPAYKNNWHKVEVVYQMNSIVGGKGQNDGVVQYWMDGALIINLHNVLLRTGANATMKWNQVSLSPFIGIGSPAAQTVWYDDLVIATGPVP